LVENDSSRANAAAHPGTIALKKRLSGVSCHFLAFGFGATGGKAE